MYYLYNMKTCFNVIVFFIMTTQITAQVCTGNLGENIFTEGDFGSGTDNVVQTDPMIAPGYIYTTNPPPQDGFYTITNNTGWGYTFGGWLGIGDNSSDPNGYMMVVNANVEPGLFYEQEIEGLCENTVYSFSADVINLIEPNFNIILPNVSFLIDGMVQYQTGDIPENGQWNTYGFTFTTPPGQTSVVLSLRNNAPGGIGNDLALDNIAFRPCGPEALILSDVISNVCNDGMPIDITANIVGNQYDMPVYQWQISTDGINWTDITGANADTYMHTDFSAGMYYYRYLLANGMDNLLNSKCRVISDVQIINILPNTYVITDTLCQGLSFSLGNNLYSTTGIYTDTLMTTEGCDSIVTLDLTIVPNTQIDAILTGENPSCSYLQDGSVGLDTILGGIPPFSVSINGVQDDDFGAFNLGGGDYVYQITDQYGCTFEETISLETPIPFTVDIGNDLIIELGEQVTISPNFSLAAESYEWQPAGICEPDCNTLDFTPSGSLTVFINAISEMGCFATDSIRINIDNTQKVFIPNVFSPNADGDNDFFTVFGDTPNVAEIEQLTIYDRWGGLVFEQNNFQPNNPTLGWDGTARAKALNPGVYLYVARVRFLDGEMVTYSGDVTLVR